jgi:hypothetical protein
MHPVLCDDQLKKKMYYNMRVRTLKRNATNVISKAFELQRGALVPSARL